MSRINIIVSGIPRNKFSGGLLCVFEYANGLAEMGHEVRVIPITSSSEPEWFKPKFEIMHLRNSFWNDFAKTISVLQEFLHKNTSKREVGKSFMRLFLHRFRKGLPYSFQRAMQIDNLYDNLPPADITLATHYSTAIVAYMFGSGKKFYFAQHFEPYFSVDYDEPDLAFIDAWLSYRLPLQIIANSSWLADRLYEEFGIEARICPNAIRHEDFYPDGNPPATDERFIVVSYGGRNAKWKGFEDAAEAIRLAREVIPNLEWRVFGDALLPPDNEIASYVPLGFITGSLLRRAYSSAHVLLASSWYESFPLFPLEAMASGTAVVTTPFGTEDYARHLHNAYVVPPKEPKAMAEAIVTLYKNEGLRQSLSVQAAKDAKLYTWERSVGRMAEIMGLSNPAQAVAQ